MSRLPVRWQVTLAFAAALSVVLVAVGGFLYLRFEWELSQGVDNGLSSRAVTASALVRRSGSLAESESPLAEDGERFAQLLSPTGSVVAGTPGAQATLLTRDEMRRARTSSLFVGRDAGGPEGEPLRLLAMPLRGPGGPRIVVVGASLDDTREALSTLLVLEVMGLGAALVLASAAGFWASGIALRPVERMRRQAEAITDESDRRLTVPPVDDELGRLGTTLNAMLARLERASTAQKEAAAKERRFIADASHELRTPLTIMRSEIDVAMLERRSREELRSALSSTAEEAKRLSRLADDLLVLARADEGRLPMRPETTPVRELLEGVAARRGGSGGMLSREVVIDAPTDLAVCADRLRLEQALTNLLDNALAHGSGRVELFVEDAGEELLIGVRDHGPGFPDEFLPQAFERFARGDAGRSGGGAGLGLAIVEAIARSHGGSATASGADPGARVVIALPRRLIVS